MTRLISLILTIILLLFALTNHKPVTHNSVQVKTDVAAPQAPKKVDPPIAPVEAPKAAVAAPAPVSAPIVAPAPKPVAAITGSKQDWMTQAGIPVSDWVYVDYIIQKESGWNPQARNASSGAGGLPQALPYTKTGCAWGDAICQLKWADSYAKSRYGSWAGSYNHWTRFSWW